ncbi:MAG: hypothetical protein ACRDT6_01245 [Micromonosporaceae bacterium]
MGEYESVYLSADLYELLRMARVKLPEMGELYLTANRRVARTSDNDAAAFTPQSRIYPAWRDLRDEFQTILGQTAVNIGDIARALELVVETYERTDSEAADMLNATVADSPESHAGVRAPWRSPQPEMPKE